MTTKHYDWALVERLENVASFCGEPFGPLCKEAADLIRQLKRDVNRWRNEADRHIFPDTSGQ